MDSPAVELMNMHHLKQLLQEFTDDIKDSFMGRDISTLRMFLSQCSKPLSEITDEEYLTFAMHSHKIRYATEITRIFLCFRCFLSRKGLIDKLSLPMNLEFTATLYMHSESMRKKATDLLQRIVAMGNDPMQVRKALNCSLRWSFETGQELENITLEAIYRYIKRLESHYKRTNVKKHVGRLVCFHNWLIDINILSGVNRIVQINGQWFCRLKPMKVSAHFWEKIDAQMSGLCKEALSRSGSRGIIQKQEMYVLRWALVKLERY